MNVGDVQAGLCPVLNRITGLLIKERQKSTSEARWARSYGNVMVSCDSEAMKLLNWNSHLPGLSKLKC